MQQTFSPSNANVSLSKISGKYQALRLPYQESTGLAAMFVLPDESYSSIADAVREITGQMVLEPSSWAPLGDRLDVSLPRFKVEAKLDLKEVSTCTCLWQPCWAAGPADWPPWRCP